MSRHKSETTLEREREREIRRERLERKKAEKEAKRAARAEKARLRELCRTRELKPVEPKAAGFLETMNGKVHLFCSTCRTAKKETEMKTATLCESCFYNAELGGATQKDSLRGKHHGEQVGAVQAPACSGQGSFGLQDRPEKKVNLNIGK